MPSPEPVAPAPERVRVDGHERLELDSGWQVAACAPEECATPADAAGLDWLAASVPGTAAGALREAGLWDFGDERDLDAEDWWFRTGFEAAPAAAGETVLLGLDGVATFHEVFLNGERIGVGESMFAAARIDIGERLREGRNELAIRCLALAPKLGAKRRPRARWRAMLADNRLRFVRSMLLGRCPGFAPGPAAVGPWRPVWVERRRTVEVTGLALRPRVEGTDGVLAVAASVRGTGGFEVTAADLVLTGADEVEASLEVVPGADGEVGLRGEIRVPEVALWWPHTHGEPALHQVRFRVAGPEGEVGIDAGRVGFRELAAGPGTDHDLLRDGLDLHLNGVAVFARGAVWTPVDFVGMAPDRARLRAALEQARDAGMNMVRVPGTAAYESEDFHDLCDELGILVWQDFAFANFDYPFEDEEFRALAEAEAGEQLARLAGRPSLAVCCGNSEVGQQVAMLGLDPELGEIEFFDETLPAAVRAATDAIYLPSAPCGGTLSFRPDRGVANYFGVGGYLRPLADARLAGVRFAAECLAFANVPGPEGIEDIAPGARDLFVHEPRWKAGVPRDAGAAWDFDDVRDHYLGVLYDTDPFELRRTEPERYLEISRMVSGEVMAAVFGEWRRAGSPCNGGLVLWMQDLVPGAGWGLCDSAGRPKPAWHHLRRAFAPRAVWLTDEGLGGVAVHVANDTAEELVGTLRIGLYRDGEQPAGEARHELRLEPHEGASFDVEELLGRFVDAAWAYRFGPPSADVIVAEVESAGGERLRPSFLLPAGRPREVRSAEELGFEASAHAVPDGIVLSVSTGRFVHGLCVDAAGLEPEDDAFSVEPGREREVRLVATGEPAGSPKIFLTAVNLAGKVPVAVEGAS